MKPHLHRTRNATQSKWNLCAWMGVFTLHVSNIKGIAFKFARARPVWMRPKQKTHSSKWHPKTGKITPWIRLELPRSLGTLTSAKRNGLCQCPRPWLPISKGGIFLSAILPGMVSSQSVPKFFCTSDFLFSRTALTGLNYSKNLTCAAQKLSRCVQHHLPRQMPHTFVNPVKLAFAVKMSVEFRVFYFNPGWWHDKAMKQKDSFFRRFVTVQNKNSLQCWTLNTCFLGYFYLFIYLFLKMKRTQSKFAFFLLASWTETLPWHQFPHRKLSGKKTPKKTPAFDVPQKTDHQWLYSWNRCAVHKPPKAEKNIFLYQKMICLNLRAYGVLVIPPHCPLTNVRSCASGSNESFLHTHTSWTPAHITSPRASLAGVHRAATFSPWGWTWLALEPHSPRGWRNWSCPCGPCTTHSCPGVGSCTIPTWTCRRVLCLKIQTPIWKDWKSSGIQGPHPQQNEKKCKIWKFFNDQEVHLDFSAKTPLTRKWGGGIILTSQPFWDKEYIRHPQPPWQVHSTRALISDEAPLVLLYFHTLILKSVNKGAYQRRSCALMSTSCSNWF